jgi:hypothetical protein
MGVLGKMLLGTAAGSVGTVALNAATYADMALRGKPASSVPAQVADELAKKVGLDPSLPEREDGRGELPDRMDGILKPSALGSCPARLSDSFCAPARIGAGK